VTVAQWPRPEIVEQKPSNAVGWSEASTPPCQSNQREETARTLAAKQVSSCCWCLRAYASPCFGRVENARRDQALCGTVTSRECSTQSAPHVEQAGGRHSAVRANVTQCGGLTLHTPIARLSLPGEHIRLAIEWGRGLRQATAPPPVPKCMSEVNIGGAFPRTDCGSKGIRGCSVEQRGTKEPYGKLVCLRRVFGALCPWAGR
jgi:hypothetical protein